MVFGVAVGSLPSFFTPKLSSSSQWVHSQSKSFGIISSSLADERGLLDNDDDKSSKIDRRKLLASPVGLLAVSLGSSLGNGVALASNFADERGLLDNDDDKSSKIDRRKLLASPVGLLAVSLGSSLGNGVALASNFAEMPALKGKDYGKTKMKFPDYAETSSGLQYKDLRPGSGPTPKKGDIVVVDWDGYTIGYYGRIFEARNKTKGGSFEGDDKSFYRFRLGTHEVIPAFEEAVMGMSLGGVRRIIVPPDLGYPDNDYNKSGPKPTTFSGQRALSFVLKNQGLIDKTLLFDIELLNIIPN